MAKRTCPDCGEAIVGNVRKKRCSACAYDKRKASAKKWRAANRKDILRYNRNYYEKVLKPRRREAREAEDD